MKCIGYDAKWLAQLVEDYPKWKQERAEKAAKAKAARESGGKGVSRKRKRTTGQI